MHFRYQCAPGSYTSVRLTVHELRYLFVFFFFLTKKKQKKKQKKKTKKKKTVFICRTEQMYNMYRR